MWRAYNSYVAHSKHSLNVTIFIIIVTVFILIQHNVVSSTVDLVDLGGRSSHTQKLKCEVGKRTLGKSQPGARAG